MTIEKPPLLPRPEEKGRRGEWEREGKKRSGWAKVYDGRSNNDDDNKCIDR